MTWLGGIVLGLGVALVVVLVARRVRQTVLQRRGAAAEAASYAGRLSPDRENGAGDEVNRMADQLIREHGAGAVIEAAHRAIAELDDDDRKGQAVWQRVLESALDSAKESQHTEGSGNGPNDSGADGRPL